MSEKTIKSLNHLLANMNVMVTKLHNYHWNVSGLEFAEIHSKTQSYYEYFFEQYDDVAERILQLKAKPIATLKGCLEIAAIAEETGENFTPTEVLKAVLADFETLLEEIKLLQSVAAEDNDTPTSDMLDGQRAWFEKEIWMLNATLGK